jgi:hypothetical protein
VLEVAAADPVLEGSDLISPSVYMIGGEAHMAYGGSISPSVLHAVSPDGLQVFAPQTASLLSTSQCAYCSAAAAFPQVLSDTSQATDGGVAPWLMLFSAADTTGAVSIGRASSPDGVTWTPEPAPVLQGDLSGEAVLLSPRVMLDGSIYKMWYSFASLAKVIPTVCLTQANCPTTEVCDPNKHVCVSPVTDPFSTFCEAGTTINVGYATSADGFFWTRSPSNPVLDVDKIGQSGDHALLLSAVIPADAKDPASGVTLYYSTFRRSPLLANRCVPNGISRATATP